MARRLVELLVGPAGTRWLRSQAYLANDLALLELGCEHIDEEGVQVDIAFTIRPSLRRHEPRCIS